ncbi:MAG: cytochrome c biogenesis protein ResB [bacterium]|nr:cytochrome c biogenesis protein ResB [bacterium]
MAVDVLERTPTPPPDPAPGRSMLAELPLAAYRFLHSKVTGLVIILVMAFLALLGTMIAQIPAGVRQEPERYGEWLAQARERYGGLTDILHGLGMFNIYSSVWFIAIALLLTLSIIACTTHRLPQLWKRATRPNVRVSEGFFRHAAVYGSTQVDGDTEAAYAAAVEAVKAKGYRVVDDEGATHTSMYADRFRWGPFGTAAAHSAFVVIIIGMLVTSLAGIERYMPITVGGTAEVGEGTDLSVEVVGFADTYNPDGSPKDYVSHLMLRDAGQVVADQEIRVNTPLRYQGARFHQTHFGAAVEVTITDASGATVWSQGIPLEFTSTNGQYAVGIIEIPERGIEVRAYTPASGRTDGSMAPGEMTLVVFPLGTSEPILEELLLPGQNASLDGLTYTFVRESKYTGLTYATDPGVPWIWVGSALLMAGMTSTFGFRHRRLWLRITPDEAGSLVRIAAVDRLDPIQERNFRSLLDTIGETREFALKRTETDRA